MDEIKVNPITGEMLVPEKIDDAALATLLTQSMANSMNIFQKAGLEKNVTDTPLKAFKKLETKDITMQLLHITVAHISRASIEEKARVSIETTDYPVMAFKEYPGYYYCGGKRLMQTIGAWAEALGDEVSVVEVPDEGIVFEGNRLLPKLNEYISQGNYPAVVLKTKKGRSREYIEVYVLGI